MHYSDPIECPQCGETRENPDYLDSDRMTVGGDDCIQCDTCGEWVPSCNWVQPEATE